MPVKCDIAIRNLSADEFAARDRHIMGHAFAAQNQLGHFCDEGVYESDLKARLLQGGVQNVYTQVPVTVTHEDFRKQYYLDLVADDALYELKTAKSIIGEHKTQLLNYILLLGIVRGKLLNFHGGRVSGQIIATGLSYQERLNFTSDSDRWHMFGVTSTLLFNKTQALLKDWGAFLDLLLYQDALIHFLGGEEKVVRLLPLKREGHLLGNQRFYLISPELAFRITAFTNNLDFHEKHLYQLVSLTPLKALQWINLNHKNIQFITVFNPNYNK